MRQGARKDLGNNFAWAFFVSSEFLDVQPIVLEWTTTHQDDGTRAEAIFYNVSFLSTKLRLVAIEGGRHDDEKMP